ncbi:hypothetical protein [Fortiea contorta]|uniref:hypothetical protein n=1 Tax=Fortiea contorta TaxID=1892405 RepID=UPI00037CA20E|nr:hypothetical protein [Fortiea contorta]
MTKNQALTSDTSISLLLTISLTTLFLFPIPFSLAETNLELEYSKAPLNIDILKNPPDSLITANTINKKNLTIPGLWRVKENTESKLVDNWIAYPATDIEPQRVDLIVNQQIWSFLEYVERYDFVNRFGVEARKHGYNIRVFSNQQELLATYTCNVNKSDPFLNNKEILCNIKIKPQDKISLVCRWFLASCYLPSVTSPISNSPIKP